MILQSIRLEHYRNFKKAHYNFNPHVTIIIGENARGKTNLLEGVYLAVHGTGFRESKEEELIQWSEQQALIETTWKSLEEESVFQIAIQSRLGKVEKKFYINKTKKNHFTYNQFQTKAVLFAPEHIDIVTASPDRRRDYFNKLLFVVDPDYKKCVHNYDHALYKRNKILEHFSTMDSLKEQLMFWDGYLEKQASYITKKRQEYTEYLNENPSVDGKSFSIKYMKSELTCDLLDKCINEDKRMRRTTIGPQKDDFQINLRNGEEKNIHHFGSRSEQRLGVFWLKLNEIRFLEAAFKSKPVLLLDDIFSELDTKNKQVILNLIENYQTLLTTTEKELLDLAHMDKAVINL
jgi:DNA replication and repair protein RecF